MTGDLAVELDRVVDRLRGMPLTKLSAPWPPYPSRAAGARALAQRLADAAADVSGEPRRVVPDVGDSAVGDQVAVTGADLIALEPPEELAHFAANAVREVRLTL